MAERPLRLEGKVAIVTGAGSSGEGVGNGKAASILFAREGAKVLLVDFQEDRARETLQMIHDEGGVASTLQGDMTKLEDCERMAETAMERYGRVEAEALETSMILNIALRELNLPEDTVIGAILRDGEVIVPNGDLKVQAHDHVLMVTTSDSVAAIEKLFEVHLEFF